MKMKVTFTVKVTLAVKSLQFMMMLPVFSEKKSNFTKLFSLCKLRNHININ